MRRQTRQRLAFGLVSVLAWGVTLPILLVIGLILKEGLPGLSWGFLSDTLRPSAVPANSRLPTSLAAGPAASGAWPGPRSWSAGIRRPIVKV